MPASLDQRRILAPHCQIKPGDHFGRYRVIGAPFARRFDCGKRLPYVVCECACGTLAVVGARTLRSGKAQSCGCLAREQLADRVRTHGETGTRLYRIWGGMHDRCRNPRNAAYPHYGGRHIAVCREWGTFEAFRKWAERSGYRDHLYIHRADIDGDYAPDNCRWITPAGSAKHRRYCKFSTTLAAIARLAVAAGVPKDAICEAVKCTRRTLDYALRGDTWPDPTGSSHIKTRPAAGR